LYSNISRANIVKLDKISNDLKDLFKYIFTVDENKRPTCSEIMENSYFIN
jgi:hypothetical protein